jgi:hypothetical protein
VTEHGHWLPPCLNRYILKLTIKAPGQISKLLQIEIIQSDEMNHKIFDIDIDMNVWDNIRNSIEPISFHRFHGPSNWLAYALSGCISFIHSYKLLPC